jgi:hypothetical protein
MMMSELSIGSGYTLEDVDKLTSFLIGIGSLQQADIINVLRVSYFNQNQTIEALQQSQWVSVEDAPKGKEVLILLKSTSSDRKIVRTGARVQAEDHDWESDGFEIANCWDIIGWMPLPPVEVI